MAIYVVNLLRLYRHKLRLYRHIGLKWANLKGKWGNFRPKWTNFVQIQFIICFKISNFMERKLKLSLMYIKDENSCLRIYRHSAYIGIFFWPNRDDISGDYCISYTYIHQYICIQQSLFGTIWLCIYNINSSKWYKILYNYN